MIICAAIKLNMNNIAASEHIVHGRRHGDCWNTISRLMDNWKHATKTEGFVTHTGEFLDRWEAFEHARACGQVSQTTKWKQEDESITELYSEDLY